MRNILPHHDTYAPGSYFDKLFKMHFVAKWQVAKSNAECAHLFQIIFLPVVNLLPPVDYTTMDHLQLKEEDLVETDGWMGRSSQWEIFVNELNSCD